MLSRTIVCWIAAGGLSLGAFAQKGLRTSPVPDDPLEIVAGRIRAVHAGARRTDVVSLLGRARDSYALRGAGRGYDLKVTFTVNSGGQTEHDGVWQMEDLFDPNQGHRWTARSGAYAITRISSNGMLYGEETAAHIPLRLQEARAALFDPIPSLERVNRASIRTSKAIYNGAQLTCVLLSGPRKTGTAAPGRRWNETEDCIDPQSGLLQTHSQVPGRYYAYDYTNAPRLAGRVLPRKVIVTEAGKVVTEISVDSLTELPAADPSLFVPTPEMQARGRAVRMAGAQKIVRVFGQGPFAPGAAARPVCVFGVVTPSGQIVEAHSLQPSDPNSAAALKAATRMTFTTAKPLGAQPEQHFVFLIWKFVGSP